MRIIERIQNMSAAELADAILENDIDDRIKFCDGNHNCGKLNDIPEEMCRECLIEWLLQEDTEAKPDCTNLNSEYDWEREAKKQTAAAGEIKMQLAEHLEDVRNNISLLRQQARTETNDMSIALIQWKLEQLQKEENWLESLLFAKTKDSVMETWKTRTLQRFERNE